MRGETRRLVGFRSRLPILPGLWLPTPICHNNPNHIRSGGLSFRRVSFLPLLTAVALGAVHLFAHRLRFLDGVPRSRWLSLAGGASVAYIFVYLLPELAALQADLVAGLGERLTFLERHVYLLALVGLTAFYGLERAAKAAGAEKAEGVYRLHMASYGLYNLLVGYLLVEQPADSLSLLLFFLAMGFHFLVNDYGLRQHFETAFVRRGRWFLAGAVLVGWGVGVVTPLSRLLLSVLLALLSGGVVLNTLKEELPEERESRFGSFLLGAVLYTTLLLVL